MAEIANPFDYHIGHIYVAELPLSFSREPFFCWASIPVTIVVEMVAQLLSRQESAPLPPPPTQAYLEENYAPRMLAVDGTLFGLALLCVLLRVYTRVFMLKTFGTDGMYQPILVA